MSFGETARITAKYPVRRICRPENGTPVFPVSRREGLRCKVSHYLLLFVFLIFFMGEFIFIFFVFAKFLVENFLFVAIF